MSKFFKITSKLSFIIVLSALFLPFIVVKCADEDVAFASGVDLIKGEIKEVKSEKRFNPENPFEEKKIEKEEPKTLNEAKGKKEPNPYIIAIAILSVIGLVVGFLNFYKKSLALSLISLIGVGLLVGFGYTIDGFVFKLSEEYQNAISSSLRISLQEGFYLAFFGFLLNFLEPIFDVFQDQEFEN